MIDGISKLEIIASLDWSGPVADIQRSLAKLRLAGIRQFKWITLLSPLIGFCGLLVGGQWLFEWLTLGRLSVIDKLNVRWVVGNYLFGVVFVPVGYFLACLLARKCHRHQWWQSVLDDISGKSLHTATLEVTRWAELQTDAAPKKSE
jgi:hypothetical protein